MRYNHFTFPVGGPACDAKCPFCVSKMTGLPECGSWKKFVPSWNRFGVACEIAKKSPELTTALLTGKGEPTLYPELVTMYLDELKKRGGFPIVEMQTNGMNIASGKLDEEIVKWHELGLQTIAISVVHYEQEMNQKIYCNGSGKDHYDLSSLIKKLHDIGYSIRMCVMLMKGFVDNFTDVQRTIEFAYGNEVEQLTFRNITVTDDKTCKNEEVFNWTIAHQLDDIESLYNYIKVNGTKIMELNFGATVYGMKMYDGGEQNICLSNCLTETDSEKSIRQLIFFPEGRGRIGYSWQHEAATIL